MPRGVPASGFRKTRTKKADKTVDVKTVKVPEVVETDAEIFQRITERFEVLALMAQASTSGDATSLIVSGPAGLGKSFTIEKALKDWDPDEIYHTIVKGYIRPPSLYRLLYQHRDSNQVLVFDDADSVFFDDVSLSLLKAACDSNKNRRISYLTEGSLLVGDAVFLPRGFDFHGNIIFITNLDFDALINKGHKLAPHLTAMISRSHYIDLAMKTKRDYLIRIKHVVANGMLKDDGLSSTAQDDIVAFIFNNQDKMRELSLRMVRKVADIRRKGNPNWEKIALVTCCRG
jgi:hypothetical protein